MIAYRVPRDDVGDYGYEIADADGTVVERGVMELSDDRTTVVARPDLPDGTPGPPRPGSVHPTSPEVLIWLSEHGPAGGAR